jgi:enediyne polyketide synthase
MQQSAEVAVVGLACRYPGAESPLKLWENVLACRREFRRIPDVRLPSASYMDADPSAPDKCYINRAALVDGYKFDWQSKRIPRGAYESTDIVQWLALDVAEEALRDAGYRGEGPLRDRTGVIVGNSLTGEQSRSNTMRLRWPFVERALGVAAAETGLGAGERERLAASMEALYKSVFAPISEDTLAGGLSNTIAGRICNFFDFHGGGYTVDGACSSSLLAVCTAADYLASGVLDVALAGGVDVSLDPFELVGFAKAGALARTDMRVYDREANGFLPGEGCGFIVLKRLADARRDGDSVYAVIRGWGISSDGKGGITAPSVEGQATALRRAYERAGVSMATLSFIEGHGTGTPLGDRTELRAVARALGQDEAVARRVGMTSLKSIVGHTKAAAGVGGLIKAIMAVNRRVLPPTAACDTPNPVFDTECRGLFPLTRGEVLPASEVIRAGVSAMGFGGINSHIVLESGSPPSAKLAPSIGEAALVVSRQSSELFIASAASVEELRRELERVAGEAEDISVGDLTDLAHHMATRVRSDHPVRCATVASHPQALAQSLRAAAQRLAEGRLSAGGELVSEEPGRAFWLGHAAKRPRVGYLMPGQGSQQLGMGRMLIQRFDWARELAHQADLWTREYTSEPLSQLIDRPLHRLPDAATVERWKVALADAAQPAVCLTSVLYAEFLRRLGVEPLAVTGHSLGELTACYVAGAFDAEALLKLAALRGKAMSAQDGRRGQMASLSCDEERAAALCSKVPGYIVIANVNSPRQVVVSGDPEAIQAVERLATAEAIQARLLPVANAFHSSYVQPAARRLLEEAPVPATLGRLNAKLISSVDGRELTLGTPLRQHFSEQALRRVDFVKALRAMAAECDVLIECGPGRVLTGLAQETLSDTRSTPCSVAARVSSQDDLHATLARLFVAGANLEWPVLFASRLVRPYRPAAERVFIENPLERPFVLPDGTQVRDEPTRGIGIDPALMARAGVTEAELHAYLRERGDFISTVIAADLASRRKEGLPASAPAPRQLAPARAAPSLAAASTGGASTATRLEERIVELVAERTGYRKESITLAARMLDDLNLDSIKAGDLVLSLAKEFGAAGRVEAGGLSTATLAEVVEAVRAASSLEQAEAAGAQPSSKPAQERSTLGESQRPVSTWVRNYGLKAIEQPLADEAPQLAPGSSGVVVCGPDERALGGALRKALAGRGIAAEAVSFAELTGALASRSERPSFAIIMLPQAREEEGSPAERLMRAVERLRGVAVSWAAGANGQAKGTLAFVTRAGGRFGISGAIPQAPEQWACMGLAESLHFEQPQSKVRVVDLSPGIDEERSAELILRELSGELAFRAAGYDDAGQRSEPQIVLHQPVTYRRREVQWGPQDVILVTGGAKGITARCALEVAAGARCRFALVGSSSLEQAQAGEAGQNLARFAELGVECRYYTCDISDAEAVRALFRRVEAELGAITGIIHGAGANKPRRLEQVTAQEAVREVGPKLLGAMHLFELACERPVKLIAALSSIIGVTGIPGNGWYAYSNEALDLMLRRIARQHPGIQTISVAFGVWSEIGMGARLGSVERLARFGIGAIPPDEGARRFAELFFKDPGTSVVVTTGMVRGLDTWRRPAPGRAASLRFIDEVSYVEPGVELVNRTRLSIERDPYLVDHDFRGSLLFPTVFGLEAMVEAVAYTLGAGFRGVRRIEAVSLVRPIVVSPAQGTVIELHVAAFEQDERGETRVSVSIRSEQDGFQNDYFSAVVVVGEPEIAQQVAPAFPPALDLDPRRDLYGGMLFQGPRFQRIERVHRLTSGGGLLTLEGRTAEAQVQDSFGEARYQLLLDDPFVRDVVLQSGQLAVPDCVALPVGIGKIEYFAAAQARGEQRVEIILTARTERELCANVSRFDASGRLVERVTDYRLHILEVKAEWPTPEEISERATFDAARLKAEIQRLEQELDVRAPEVRLGWASALAAARKEERHVIERELVLGALAGMAGEPGGQGPLELEWLPSGKPVLRGSTPEREVSLSTQGAYLLFTLGQAPQGCDLESIEPRSRQDWLGLVGERHGTLLETLAGGGVGLDRAGTMLWSVREAGIKALQTDRVEITLLKRAGRSALFEVRGGEEPVLVAAAGLVLARGPERVIATRVELRGATTASEGAPAPAAGGVPVYLSEFTQEGPGRRAVHRMRFPISFREAATLGRSVYFTHYLMWMGKARELAMRDTFAEMVPEFSSGKTGAVTNWAFVEIFDELPAAEVVQVSTHLGEVTGSRLTTIFEFSKVLPDGRLHRVAAGEMAATWVRVLDHGVVDAIDFPPYLKSFIRRVQPLEESDPRTPPPADSLSLVERGALVHDGSTLAGGGVLLAERSFSTSFEESNLVGNIYFSNYFVWQGRVRDNFLHQVIPELLRGTDAQGELLCTFSSMNYLRESMPFDEIHVVMRAQRVYTCGMDLEFSFFRGAPGQGMEKLAVGLQKVLWTQRVGGKLTAGPLPPRLLRAASGQRALALVE